MVIIHFLIKVCLCNNILFIILGLSYGIVNKTIKNHRDMCSQFSHSLDGIGKVIVLIFMASMFIFIFKATNIGTLIVASFANLVGNSGFSGIPLYYLCYLLVPLVLFLYLGVRINGLF